MIVPTGNIPFYWSNRRRTLFRRCKLRYFLYCYGAWGGNDVSADAAIREVHRQKRLQSFAEYLDGLCVRILREHFYHRPDSSLRQLGFSLLRRELTDMRDRTPGNDHNFPLLREFIETPASLGRLASELQNALAARIESYENGFYGKLTKISCCDRVEKDFPLQVSLGELTCYTPAFLIFRQNGDLCFADLSDTPESALFHRYSAMNQHGLPPEAVHSYSANLQTGIFRTADNTQNVTALLRAIRRDTQEMLALIHEDHTVNSNDFPAEKGEHCTTCPFGLLCNCDAGKTPF